MSIEASALLSHAPNHHEITNRKTANYRPNPWGDHFPAHCSPNLNDSDIKEHEKLKENVRSMLLEDADDKPTRKIELIDTIQRLGISYHFEREIEEIIKKIYNDLSNSGNDDNNLYITALKFRLLRQQGYKMSSDVFKKFKNNKGNFEESLVSDAEGMLSLYEASHFRVHGEEILEEALAFTTSQLESMSMDTISPSLATQIRHALKQPIRKGLPRLEAFHYFSIYEQQADRNEHLLKFYKLDFNKLQRMHQQELRDIAKWWKDLDFEKKLPFARDRIVECYFWLLGVYFEPEHRLARRILIKVIAMTSIIDDIYDVFGTPEELQLFTQAIDRWDRSTAVNLPEYMKIAYEALLNVYEEIEQNLASEGRSNWVNYAKQAMKKQVRDYFQESKWLHNNQIPTMGEYMEVALGTIGCSLLTLTSFVGMGDMVTEDSFLWVLNQPQPKIVVASTVVSRLMNDIVSHEFEQKRGHVASSIECYMKQYNANKEEAVHELQKQITDAWKDINQECLYPVKAPMPLLTRILNLTRVMDVFYKEEDGYTNVGVVLRKGITSLLIDPMPL